MNKRPYIYQLIPSWLKEYVKSFYYKLRFPNCQIFSSRISSRAIFGVGCMAARDVEIGPGVMIGDYSYVNAGTIIASGKIGKYCSIGYLCQIGMPTHPVSRLSTSPKTYGGDNIFGLPNSWDDYAAPPLIGNDVWIGSMAQIMQGVTVGDGAIIAAGSIVNKDVTPFQITAGIPSRQIGMRFNENIARQVLDLQWWSLPTASLCQLGSFFSKDNLTASDISELERLIKSNNNGD